MDQTAVKALQDIVGAENVSDAKPVVAAYVTKAIMDVSSQAPEVVVRPNNVYFCLPIRRRFQLCHTRAA